MRSAEDETVIQIHCGPDFQSHMVQSSRSQERFIRVAAGIDGIPLAQIEKFMFVCDQFRHTPCPHLPQLLSLQINEDPRNGFKKTIFLTFPASDGIALEQYLVQTRPDLKQSLHMVAQICEAVKRIHETGIIAGPLHPYNIHIKPETGTVFLSDFGPFSIYSHPVRACDTGGNAKWNAALSDSKILPYISPELTGLTNRLPDFRSDFYSLGILFYELLVSCPPFTGASPQKIIHSHMAETPPRLESPGLEIPEVISDMVQRLLSKDPEDRYQSIQGISSDVTACLNHLEQQGRIPFFPIGQNDACSRFKITDTIYGRQTETAFLNELFDKTLKGRSSFLLIRGYSGIGKTTLVRKFESELQTRQHPRAAVQFISGKFDVHKRQKPYGALIDALRDLILNILTRDAKTISAWQEEITSDPGVNVSLICEMIPEARLIFGPQPPLRALGPEESLNRFWHTITSFIRANCGPGRQLILFLDDLQWVDKGAVNLLDRIYGLAVPHLFFIGAFRENEVGRPHPLSPLISRLEQDHGGDLLSLQALPFRDITDLVRDTVNQDQQTAAGLADLLNKKTAGNPYYLKEVLNALYEDHLLFFNAGDGKWHWNHQELAAKEVTENVADLTSIRLGKLNAQLKEILNFAACLGQEFDLLVLSTALDQPSEKILPGILELVQKNILTEQPAKESRSRYRFAHDRIHHAAYRLISVPEREQRHLTIARKWYKKINPKEPGRYIFEITTHYNYGRGLVDDQAEGQILVKLNHLAAQKAKAETAFESQFHYLNICLEFLEKDCWATQYERALSLYSDAVEAAYLCGLYPEMDHLLQVVFHHARNDMDTAAVRNTQILAFKARDRLKDAIRTGLDTLKKMGVDFPQKPARHHVLISLVKTWLALARHRTEHFMDVQVLSDQKISVIQKTLSVLASSAYFVSPELGLLVAFKQLRLNRLHGLTQDTPATLAGYAGVVLSGILENPEKGYQFGRTALALTEKLNAHEQKAKVDVIIYGFINHWKSHVKNGFKPLNQAYRAGIETGDFEFAAIAKYVRGYHRIFAGENLVELEKEFAENHSIIRDLRQITTLKYNDIYWQFVRNLMGRCDNPIFLEGSAYCETDREKAVCELDDQNGAAVYYHTKMILTCLFYENEQAVQYLEKSETVFGSAVATLGVPLLHFYGALACLRISAGAVPATDRSENLPSNRQLREKAGRFIKKLKKWARHAPMNHEHKYLLVKAEQARILKDEKKAAMLYERAIALAKKHGYINEEALAWELCGAFYHAQNLQVPARVYLSKAVNCYRQWGALAKVGHLKSVYPFLSHPTFADDDTAPLPLKPSGPVDVSAIIKASEAIFGEVVIQRLMEKLMDIVFKDAGVRKAGLVLDNGKDWMVSGLVSLDDLPLFSPVPLSQSREVPVRIIRSVLRTGKNLMFHHAGKEKAFTHDRYFLENTPLSVLAIPVRHQGVTSGVLYLENNLSAGVFSLKSVNVLETVAKILANAWAANKAEKEILAYQDRLRDLSSRLLLSEEQERRKLAVALHDRIGHGLSHALMMLERLGQKAGPDSTRGLAEIRGILKRSVEDTRYLTFALSPPVLYDLGLPAALDWLAEQTYKTHKIKVSFYDAGPVRNGPVRQLDEKMSILIFQCVRELLSNVVKHAQAKEAALSTGSNEAEFWVTVEDQGSGFDPDKIGSAGTGKNGLGLFSIQERLGCQGGYMDVDAAPGKGCRVTLVVPAGP